MKSPVGGGGFIEELEESRRIIEERLDKLLPAPDEEPLSLHSAMRHSVLGGGKRLRGVLCLWTHRLLGDPFPTDSLNAACAIECLHAYTLIHDDLPALDDDDTRRGRPACHVKYGEAVAILAGDALQAAAFEMLAACSEAPAENVRSAILILARNSGSRVLVGGQVMDLEGEGEEPDGDLVRSIHSRKTAGLISASMAIGAALATSDKETVGRVESIGARAGMAFQIVDDLIDIEGDEAEAGKGLRKDGKRGKITWPACFGTENSRETASRLIEDSIREIIAMGDGGNLKNLFRLFLERIS